MRGPTWNLWRLEHLTDLGNCHTSPQAVAAHLKEVGVNTDCVGLQRQRVL